MFWLLLSVYHVYAGTQSRWWPEDNFDLLQKKMAAVTADNCKSLSEEDLHLRPDIVTHLPSYIDTLSGPHYPDNRTVLHKLHNMVMGRAMAYR